MAVTLRKATRAATKMRIGLAGTAGSGKTYSALLMASGMAPWDKIALIDTENGSGDLYAHLGPYNIITLTAPFSPERYIEAIEACEKAGMEVIILDSMTHEWDGKGGILELKDQAAGNSFTAWAKLTPRHNAFINKILASSAHMICTMRSKQDYVLVEKNGKQVPQKVGLKAITREGVEYEFTVVLDIDTNHMATASKDRTEIFMKSGSDMVIPEKISAETGHKLVDWAAEGVPAPAAVPAQPAPIAAPRAADPWAGPVKAESMEKIKVEWARYRALHGIDEGRSAAAGREMIERMYNKKNIPELTEGQAQAFVSFLSNESWKVEQSMQEDTVPDSAKATSPEEAEAHSKRETETVVMNPDGSLHLPSDDEPTPPPAAAPAKPIGKIRLDQTKKLFAVWGEYAKIAQLTADESTARRRALMQEMFGVESTTKLNEEQADNFISRVQADTQEASM